MLYNIFYAVVEHRVKIEIKTINAYKTSQLARDYF